MNVRVHVDVGCVPQFVDLLDEGCIYMTEKQIIKISGSMHING